MQRLQDKVDMLNSDLGAEKAGADSLGRQAEAARQAAEHRIKDMQAELERVQALAEASKREVAALEEELLERDKALAARQEALVVSKEAGKKREASLEARLGELVAQNNALEMEASDALLENNLFRYNRGVQ